ncbi:rhodanese-like domain-containing protein [Candidatus Woesearchaeota archaeon]|nr:rhodanese-like domain-containing protein [Candidatus Woesearchaeota archaeon]
MATKTPRDFMQQAQELMENPKDELMVTPEQLTMELEGGKKLQLIDVRQPEEVKEGKVPGAKPIPLADLPERMQELDKNADTVTICARGGRAAAAMFYLKSQGFKKVRDLMGGTLGWKEEGFDVE